MFCRKCVLCRAVTEFCVTPECWALWYVIDGWCKIKKGWSRHVKLSFSLADFFFSSSTCHLVKAGHHRSLPGSWTAGGMGFISAECSQKSHLNYYSVSSCPTEAGNRHCKSTISLLPAYWSCINQRINPSWLMKTYAACTFSFWWRSGWPRWKKMKCVNLHILVDSINQAWNGSFMILRIISSEIVCNQLPGSKSFTMHHLV